MKRKRLMRISPRGTLSEAIITVVVIILILIFFFFFFSPPPFHKSFQIVTRCDCPTQASPVPFLIRIPSRTATCHPPFPPGSTPLVSPASCTRAAPSSAPPAPLPNPTSDAPGRCGGDPGRGSEKESGPFALQGHGRFWKVLGRF